jgi:hypothetical protein
LTAHYEDYVRFFSPHALGNNSSGAPVVVAHQLLDEVTSYRGHADGEPAFLSHLLNRWTVPMRVERSLVGIELIKHQGVGLIMRYHDLELKRAEFIWSDQQLPKFS